MDLYLYVHFYNRVAPRKTETPSQQRDVIIGKPEGLTLTLCIIVVVVVCTHQNKESTGALDRKKRKEKRDRNQSNPPTIFARFARIHKQTNKH